MKFIANIYIYHIPSKIDFYTIQEVTSSLEEAKKQFSALARTIAMMDRDNHSIVLETTTGPVMFTRKFLSDCFIRLEFGEQHNKSWEGISNDIHDSKLKG